MKNLIKTASVILGVFFLVGFLISAGGSNRGTTAQSYDEDYDYAENYEDEYYELQRCLDEWKDAHSEYKATIDEAYSNLDGWGEGDEYEDLITAMDEAKYTLDSVGDNALIVINMHYFLKPMIRAMRKMDDSELKLAIIGGMLFSRAGLLDVLWRTI